MLSFSERELPQSPAFEMRDGKMVIKFEADIPSASIGGHSFGINEKPSIIVRGEKISVETIR